MEVDRRSEVNLMAKDSLGLKVSLKPRLGLKISLRAKDNTSLEK